MGPAQAEFAKDDIQGIPYRLRYPASSVLDSPLADDANLHSHFDAKSLLYSFLNHTNQ